MYEIDMIKNRSALEGMAREWDALAEREGIPNSEPSIDLSSQKVSGLV